MIPCNQGWAVKAPGGQILADTFSVDRGECYMLLWRQQDEAFRMKYWKRLDASIAAYRRRGYRIVQVSLIEVLKVFK